MGIGRGQPYWSQIIQSIMQNVDDNIAEIPILIERFSPPNGAAPHLVE